MAELESTGAGPARAALPVSPAMSRRAAIPVREWSARFACIAAVLAGGVLAYAFPAVKLDGGGTLSIQEVNQKLTFGGAGWVLSLSWFAAVVAMISAIVFPRSERFIQTLAISGGAVFAMAFPFYVSGHLATADENAKSLGSGLIGAWVAFGVAAALPWFSVLWINRAKPTFERGWDKWLFLLPAVLWVLALTVFPLIYAITTLKQ